MSEKRLQKWFLDAYRYRQRSGKTRGFTLLEIMIAVSIIALLAAIAVPNYIAMRERAIFNDTIAILQELSGKINLWAMENDRYPSTLAEAGLETIKDEWGNDFIYNPFDTAPKQALRKYKGEHPINTDYDLISMGENGTTHTNIQNPDAQDDIIRANNGGFFGYGADY